jgi:DNA-binding NarL/FixJ family response regulator
VEWEQEDRALAEAIRAAAPKARLDALTGAEREVLRLLHEGLTPAEIAQRLSIRRARLHRTIRCLHLYLEEGRRGVPGELSPLPR